MSEDANAEFDAELEALKAARNSTAVLKLQFAKLRSSVPTLSILVFEGDDDKIVYSQWIGRVRVGLRYGMFTCSGKGGVLALRTSLAEDRTNLAEGTFFFIDRDYDDLRGQASGDDLFMTDRYAVENYLVDDTVVYSAADIEFHCNLDLGMRAEVCRLFAEDYEKFLELTKEHNRGLYVARREKVEVLLPKAIGKLADVQIGAIGHGTLTAEEAVVYAKPIPADIARSWDADFEALDPKTRYRGKFALLFFSMWLRRLGEQRNLPDGGVFKRLQHKKPFRTAELTITNFASRSPLPDGFEEFIARVPQERAA